MKNQGVSLNEIAGIFIREIKNNPYVDYAQAYRDGVILVDGVGPKITRNDAMQNMQILPNPYTDLMLRFYDSLDGDTKNAEQFRNDLIFVSRLFNEKLYSPKNKMEIQMLVSRVADISDAKVQIELMRVMYNLAEGAEMTDVMKQIADRMILNTNATVVDMRKLIAVTDDRDRLRELLDRQILMAERAIRSELGRDMPDAQNIKDIISNVNHGIDLATTKAPELAAFRIATKDKFNLDKILAGKSDILKRDNDSLESQLTAAMAENAQLKQQVKQMMADAKESERIIAAKNEELLEMRKRLDEMDGQIVKLTQDKKGLDVKMDVLAQGAAKLKVGIGSRGVKNMKRMLQNTKTK